MLDVIASATGEELCATWLRGCSCGTGERRLLRGQYACKRKAAADTSRGPLSRAGAGETASELSRAYSAIATDTVVDPPTVLTPLPQLVVPKVMPPEKLMS